MTIALEGTIPSQWPRHIKHIGGAAALGVGAYCTKRQLEQEWLKEKLPDDKIRKAASYGITIVGGAAVGGLVKYAITGTKDGKDAGIVAGAIIAFLGSLCTEWK